MGGKLCHTASDIEMHEMTLFLHKMTAAKAAGPAFSKVNLWLPSYPRGLILVLIAPILCFNILRVRRGHQGT